MIRHLPFFAVVAEEQHFQRAADRLHITQSALSRRIKLLEDEMGITLFERLPRGVRLTPAGESFYKDVCKVQADLEQARERAISITSGRQGRITVALNPSGVNHPVVREIFRVMRQRYPEVHVSTKLVYSEEQLTVLSRNEVELGVLYQLGAVKGFSYLPIGIDNLVLAMPSSHPHARKRYLRLADLKDTPFIWPARAGSPQLSDKLIAGCHARGFSPKIDFEVQTTESVVSIVAMGVAVGFVTSNYVGQLPDSVGVRRIEDFPIELQLSLAWRSDYASPMLSNFIAVAKSVATELNKGTCGSSGQRPKASKSI